MDRFFPKEKIVNLGNPVRADLLKKNISPEEARIFYGLDPHKKTIVLIGGSLGAKSLNEATIKSIEVLKRHDNIQLLWQCGKLYFEQVSQSATAGLKNVKAMAFLERMDLAYAAADVVISRAGALSISEICLVAKPVILVPSPNVAEDHQTSNAMSLVAKNAAILVRDADADLHMIAQACSLLGDPEKCHELSRVIGALAKPHAAADIAAKVLSIAVEARN
jgi:UDP-N-acetylglucosamine--N-acetylmuramyl-(pentapeptide) pyrophosphoryl-undecaprenol N-acetylglucosamine transferase